MQEAKESIGAGLLPVMGQLIPLLVSMAGFIQDNSTAFVIIGGVIATVSAAIIAANFAIKAYTLGTQLATAALTITVLR